MAIDRSILDEALAVAAGDITDARAALDAVDNASAILRGELDSLSVAIQAAQASTSVIETDVPPDPGGGGGTPTPGDFTPVNASATATADRRVTLEADPDPRVSLWRFKEEIFSAGTDLSGGPFTSPIRVSPILAVGTYRYRIVAVVNGVEYPSPPITILVDGTPRTVNADGTAPPAPADLDAEWDTVRLTQNEANMKAWMLAHTGPRQTSATIAPGGTISTQGQADAMIGKTVTQDVLITGTNITFSDVVFRGGRVEWASGSSGTMEHFTIDGNNQTYSADHHRIRGNVTLRHGRIRQSQDGVKTFAGSNVTYRFMLISEPSQVVGGLTGSATHQDGIQMMGGSFDGEAVYIDYEGNHAGGQGILVKADSGAMSLFRFARSFLKAGGNMLTFEPTSLGAPTTIDVGGTGTRRNVIAPAANMVNVLSLYEPNGALPSGPRSTLLSSSFFIANKVPGAAGSTRVYANGITKAMIS